MSSGPSQAKGEKKPATDVVGRLLSLVFLAAALALAVFVYRRSFPPKEPESAEADQAQQDQTTWSSNDDGTYYTGVEDPWVEGDFTTGNAELDAQVKAFCDANTTAGATPRQNAYDTYLAIVWSTFEARGPDDTPSGPDWEIASARHFLSTGSPETGKGGKGDNYEFAATTTFCMRYFGFWDAITVPIPDAAYAGYNSGSALCLVSDEYGQACVCDPAYSANGWLLDRDLYNITVQDIGQDLSRAEALGLTISEPTSTVVDLNTSIMIENSAGETAA